MMNVRADVTRRFAALLFVVFLCSVSLACFETNPATGKKDFILLSGAEEISIGQSLHAEMKTKYDFSVEDARTRRLHAIGKRISDVCDRGDIQYNFNLVEEPDLNAFAAPGGFIYATAGLVKAANDDELACVMAHECGHVEARHGVKTLQTGMLAQLFIVLIDKNSDSTELKVASAAAFNLMMLGYSRKYEYEADLLAVRYSWRAGYNPRGMATFFAKLQKMEQSHGSFPEFLSTHPDTQKRINQVNKIIRDEYSNPDGSLKKPGSMPVRKPAEVSNPS